MAATKSTPILVHPSCPKLCMRWTESYWQCLFWRAQLEFRHYFFLSKRSTA